MYQIVLKTDFNLKSGYNTILDAILRNQELYTIDILPISFGSVIPNEYNKYFINSHTKYDLELILHPPPEDHMLHPIYRLNDHPNRIFFTMWEATKIHPLFVDVLNKCKCVIVPNEWNKDNFIKCGVKSDIRVVNLFVDDTIYNYTPPVKKQYITFGTSNADPRKRIHDVIGIFGETFRDISDVKLSVKISKSEKEYVNRILNPKINVIIDDYTDQEMVDWYSNIDVYISCVSAEGWGLMQHEAMAVGRPVIAPSYAGLNEYLTSDVSYPIHYTEVPAEKYWKYPGSMWSKYDKDDLKRTLLHCYNNRHEIYAKGLLASKKMTKLNINKFMSELLEIIQEYYISDSH